MNPSLWTGAAAAAGGLLTVAGLAKVARPADTARALRLAGIPASPTLVRCGAALEAVIGGWALLSGDPLARVAVAVSYLAFTLYLAWVLARRLPVSSCGCLGEPDVPPTRTHVALNLSAGAAAAGAAIWEAPGLLEEAAHQPLAGVPFVGLVGVAVALAVAVLSALPRLQALALERPR